MIVLAQSEGPQAASPSAVRPGLRHCGREPWSRPALNRKGAAMNNMGVRHGCRCGTLGYFCDDGRLGRFGLFPDGAPPTGAAAASVAPLISEILRKRRADGSAHWRLHPCAV